MMLLLLVMGIVAQAQTVVSLNGEWQFFYAKDVEQADSFAATGFQREDYKSANFKLTPVPSNWAVLGYEEPVYRGFKDNKASEGFYRLRFRTPEGFNGKRVLLHFGGVWNSAEVWLNGKHLGRHDSGYTSFTFNITGDLNPKGDNILAVRVRQVYPGYKTDTYDDWTLGGIYRDVTIESMPKKRWIDRVAINTTFSNDYRDGELTVRTIVADKNKTTLPGNYPSPGKPYKLRFLLTDKGGKVIKDETVDVKARASSSRETTENIHVPNVNQWNAETPYLYSLKVELLENGNVVQSYNQKIGFREISTKDGVFRINGQPVKLRGVNRHDEWPTVGRATTREHWLKDLKLMKAANINYIRACHYQHAKGFIEMCDSIGMYVGAEVSLGGAGDQMYDPAYSPAVMLRAVETVERDLNNPSVVYWSVGNEDPFTAMHLRAIRAIKGLDPTRPVLMPWNADETLPKEIDILAPHYWTAHEYDSLATVSKRPIITTEYTHAYGEDRFGGLYDRWHALTKHPAGAGGAIWMWADQGLRTPVKKDMNEYKSIEKDSLYLRVSSAGWDGITDSYRNPTRDYWETKAVYCPVYPEIETFDYTKGNKHILIPIRNDYDFTNLNKVAINWSLRANGRIIDESTEHLEAAPHTSAKLDVPTIQMITQPDESVYILLVFKDSLGNEIGRSTVDVDMPTLRTKKEKVATTEDNENIVVTNGNTTYTFNKKNGSLASIVKDGNRLVCGLRPMVWHKLDNGDLIIQNRAFRRGQTPEDYKPKVRKINVKEEGKNTIVNADVDYIVNDSNKISVAYKYTFDGDKMQLDYTLTPNIQCDQLPMVGMAVKMPNAKSLKNWFGRGPLDAWPNKRMAPVLGLWDANGMTGVKDMQWLELSEGGKSLLIGSLGYLNRDKAGDSEVRILTAVLGRAEKGRLKEAEYQVPSGKAYKGTITIEP